MNLPEPATGMRWVADLTQDDSNVIWIQVPIVDIPVSRRRRIREPLDVLSENESNISRTRRQRRNPNEIP